MEFQQGLQNSLEAVNANVLELLDYMRNGPSTPTTNTCGPVDPLEHAPRRILQSRKKLAEAATRLVQFATRPEEYLEHLSNSVRLPLRNTLSVQKLTSLYSFKSSLACGG